MINILRGLFLLLIISGCSKKDKQKHMIVIEEDRVDSAEAIEKISVTGTIVPSMLSTIYPENIRGFVEKIYFYKSDGQGNLSKSSYVNKGDLLFTISSADNEQDLNKAKAIYEKSKKEYEINKNIKNDPYKSHIIPVSEYEKSLTDSLTAKSDFDKFSHRKNIYAPCSGKIGTSYISEGQFVSYDKPLVTIMNSERVYVDFSVPVSIATKLKEGSKIYVMDSSDDSLPVSAKIIDIGVCAEDSNKEVKVRGLLDSGFGDQFMAKQPVSVNVIVSKKAGAKFVKNSAIVNRDAKKYVFVIRSVNNDLDVADMVDIETGVVNYVTEKTEVISDKIQDGDRIVIAGQHRIGHGYPIESSNKSITKNDEPDNAIEQRS